MCRRFPGRRLCHHYLHHPRRPHRLPTKIINNLSELYMSMSIVYFDWNSEECKQPPLLLLDTHQFPSYFADPLCPRVRNKAFLSILWTHWIHKLCNFKSTFCRLRKKKKPRSFFFQIAHWSLWHITKLDITVFFSQKIHQTMFNLHVRQSRIKIVKSESYFLSVCVCWGGDIRFRKPHLKQVLEEVKIINENNKKLKKKNTKARESLRPLGLALN